MSDRDELHGDLARELEREHKAYRELRAPPALAVRISDRVAGVRPRRRTGPALLWAGGVAAAAALLIVLNAVWHVPPVESPMSWRTRVPSLSALPSARIARSLRVPTRLPSLRALPASAPRLPRLRTPRAPAPDARGATRTRRHADATRSRSSVSTTT